MDWQLRLARREPGSARRTTIASDDNSFHLHAGDGLRQMELIASSATPSGAAPWMLASSGEIARL